MNDNFGFDNLDDFDSGIDTEELSNNGQSTSEDFGGFDNTNNQVDNTQGDKKAVIKTAVIAIVVGLVIIVSAFMVMRVIQNKAKGSDTSVKDIPKVTESTNNASATGNNNNVVINKPDNQSDGQNTSVEQNTSGWKSFTTADNIVFNKDYVDCIFTVVNIKNYVMVVDSESNLVVKTIISGSISGFIGTYELELPYSKGSQLKPGNNFNVKVQLGKFNDKVVVGEIKY